MVQSHLYDVRPGLRVFDVGGEQLGEVKEVREGAFKVNARFAPDYWIERQYVRSVQPGDRVVVEGSFRSANREYGQRYAAANSWYGDDDRFTERNRQRNDTSSRGYRGGMDYDPESDRWRRRCLGLPHRHLGRDDGFHRRLPGRPGLLDRLAPVLFDPACPALQRLALERVDVLAPLLELAHQPRLLEHAQVPRNGRAADVECRGELVHGARFLMQHLEHPEAGRVGERRIERGETHFLFPNKAMRARL